MDASTIAPVVAALSALGGVALTAYVQSRNQARNQTFLATSDSDKHLREQRTRDRQDSLNRLALMHKLVSKLQREFSITNLDILWRAKTTEEAYDNRYLAICGEADELRALAHLHEPAIHDEVERLHSQMNIFWGNFKNVLYQSLKGEEVDHRSSCLSEARAAAMEVGKLGEAVKRHLSERVQKVRDDG